MTDFAHWRDGIAFSVREGRAAGLTEGRMRNRAFARPFHDVRVAGTAGRIDDGIIDACSDLRTVLPGDAVFSHATAARLWGLPLPAGLDGRVHVTVLGSAPVRRRGVIGWTRTDAPPRTDLVQGLPVMAPAATWVSLAGMSVGRGGTVMREALVAVGDRLVSGTRLRGGGRTPPLATMSELREALAHHGSRRGAAALTWAVERIRHPVDSPQETRLRLGLVRARLPEPVPQPDIATAAGVRHPDLAYLDERLLLGYLGDVHRTDAATWRRDLTRVQLFQDAGYRVILIGADDVTVTGMPVLAARVRRALRR